MKKLKVGNAIAAEYITVGAHGKHVFLHVYTGDIQVQSYPARFPLSFFFELTGAKDLPANIKVEVLQNDKVKGTLEVEFPEGDERIGVLVTPQITFTIEEDSLIKVMATAENLEPTILIQKSVSLGSHLNPTT